MTLRRWQSTIKPIETLLYNCSEYNYKNDEWVPFPIGMQYSYIHHRNGICETQLGSHENLVLCALNSETDQRRRPNGINRRTIIQTLKKLVQNQHVDASSYFRILPTYKFVISPEGNGIDCHRHYEALMAGCIPIVEDRDMVRAKYGNCPILYTQDYSELTIDYLERKYETMMDAMWDFSSILLDTYDMSTQKQIKDNGNYWGKKCIGMKWYS